MTGSNSKFEIVSGAMRTEVTEKGRRKVGWIFVDIFKKRKRHEYMYLLLTVIVTMKSQQE